MGFPIRKSTDQRVFAPPRGLSQRITSFIACACQGIHQLPLRHLIVHIANAHPKTALATKKTSFSRSVQWPRLGKANHVPEIERFRRRTALPHKGNGRNPNKSSLYDVVQNRHRTEVLCKPCFLRMTPRPLDTRWWSRTGSNRRPPACKAGALPAELRPLMSSRGNGGPGRT